MESDLSRYYNIDYRDRWRFNADGTRRLTLRMIYVRLRGLPNDSATATAEGSGGWTLAHHLAAHTFQAMSGEKHPWTPDTSATVSADRIRAKASALARKRQRELDIAEGRIT